MPLFLSMFIIKAVTPYLSLRFLKKHKENKVEENNIKVARLESENRVLEFEKKELEYKKQQEELKASLSEAIHKSKLADNNSKSEEEKRDEDYKKITTYDNLILKNI
jgi:citrate lyase alpha subunit